MKDYRIFGGRLRTELEFDGLPEPASSGRPDWILEVEPGLRACDPAPELGRDRVQNGVDVRLVRRGSDLCLVYDDSGVFRISADGRRIAWSRGEDAEMDAVRMDVLGRVLPLSLHLQGYLVLHASAVVSDGGAVGFVGPKRAGKSTVALALHREGVSVLTDDILVLEVGAASIDAWPGVADLRLRRGAASAAGIEDPDAGSPGGGGRTLLRLGRDPGSGPFPLAALYLLDPPDPGSQARSVAMEPLTGSRAAAALMGQTKLGPLLGGWDAEELLERASAVVRAVPVRTLRLPRGLDRLQRALPSLVGAAAGAPADRW